MQLPDANVRSSSYFVAEILAPCRHCGRFSRVIALALPPKHETLTDGEWQKVDASAFIFYLASLPNAVSRFLLERNTEFRHVRSDDPAESHWANHCAHCASVFSDDELHCEPGGFMPGDAQEAQAISLTLVPQDFSGFAAGYALDPEFFAAMHRL